MADDKIKISWDDIARPEVDQKVRQQELLIRAQQHVAQQGMPPGAAPPQPTSLLYNTVFYMALFGFMGGIFAWIAGEVVQLALPDRRMEFQRFVGQAEEIEERVMRGSLSQSEGEREISALEQRFAGNPYVEIGRDRQLSPQERQERFSSRLQMDGMRDFVQNLIWFSVLGMILAFALAIADHVVARNWVATIINGSTGIVLGLIGGIVVGLFINKLYQIMLGDVDLEEGITLRQVFARSLGWALLGMFLSIASGVVLLNVKRMAIGLAGGFLGGLVGGLLFDVVANFSTDVVSRMIAIIAIGLVAGLGTGLIELAAKTSWLKVTGGLIAGKQFVIYKNPTTIGSSPQCEVYLFKDPQVAPQHAAIRAVPGGYDLEDLRSASGTLVNGRKISRVRLRNNDVIQIGGTTLTFQEKGK